ncbi:hypothetical protein SAMN05216486_10392 [bacterium JGI 053]|nr:hypothetical protein SAMN05216486_10392 [bacterium JGI 053]
MKKLLLDEFEVESFVTTPDPEFRVGTVEAHSDGIGGGFTEGASCFFSDCDTCAFTCGPTNNYSCAPTCRFNCTQQA